jgi:quinoprotein glucose dehydrogenase
MQVWRVAAWAALFGSVISGAVYAQHGAPDGDWPHYGGDHGSTKYSPLEQIDAENFGRLENLWVWESADKDLGDKTRFRPFHFRPTPIEVGGRLYVSTGMSQIAAID